MSTNPCQPVPASSAEAPHFIVGRDPHGWRLEAETGHRPGACEIATAPLHLNF